MNLKVHLFQGSERYTKRFIIVLSLILSHVFCPLDGEAQTSATPSNAPNQSLSPQNLSPQNLQGGPIPSPGFSVPANVTTSQTTLGLNPAAGGASGSTTTSSRVTVGQGLPGMPGGPPLGGPGGATDASTDYMNPPVVGPLFCDPAMNIPC
jgi:hypothetical protein